MGRRELARELVSVFGRTVILVALVIFILSRLPEEQNVQAFGVIIGMFVLASIYIAFFIRQLRAVQKSKFPNIRAAEAMLTTGILLLAIFSSIYVGISLSNPGAFTEVLTPFSSMYFSTTVLATVGFGDIAPNTVPARSAAMTQMILNLIYIGVVVRVFAGAAKRTLANKKSAQPIAD
jgi:voltage-gated potassium channel